MNLINCPTTWAVALLALRSASGQGPFRILTTGNFPPGLLFTPVPLLPLAEQFQAQVHKFHPQLQLARVEWRSDYRDHIAWEAPAGSAGEATLYIGSGTVTEATETAWQTLPTLPELLRSMPKDRSRLGFMKALQVLAGGLEQQLRAIETRDLPKSI